MKTNEEIILEQISIIRNETDNPVILEALEIIEVLI
jgi:hypothetical protein